MDKHYKGLEDDHLFFHEVETDPCHYPGVLVITLSFVEENLCQHGKLSQYCLYQCSDILLGTILKANFRVKWSSDVA